MYIVDIKVFAENEKEMKTLIQKYERTSRI